MGGTQRLEDAKHAVRIPISLAKPQRTQRKAVEHSLRADPNPTYTAPASGCTTSGTALRAIGVPLP